MPQVIAILISVTYESSSWGSKTVFPRHSYTPVGGIKEQGPCFLGHMVFHSGVLSMLAGLSLSSFEEMLFFSRTAFQVVSTRGVFSRSPSLLQRCWRSTPKITVPDLTFLLAFQLLGFCRLSRFPGSELSLTLIFGFRPLPDSLALWTATPREDAGQRQAGPTGSEQEVSRPRPGLQSSPARAPAWVQPRSSVPQSGRAGDPPPRRAARLCLRRPHFGGRSRGRRMGTRRRGAEPG